MRRIVLQCLLMLCCFGTFALGATRAEADTYTVTSTGDANTDGTCDEAGTGDGCTLREAITASNDAGGPNTITFVPSFTGTITLTTALPDITADVSIEGPGALDLTVQRAANAADFAIFVVTANVTASFDGLTIAGGAYDSSNENRIAGGIDGTAANIAVSNCAFANNAGFAGGGIGIQGDGTTGSTLTVDNCAFTDNTAEFGGGAVLVLGTATIANSSFINNATSGNFGGGILTYAGTLDVSSSLFSGNTAVGEGGGITNFAQTAVTNSTFTNNSAVFGGAIESDGSNGAVDLTVESCTITGNSADTEGSGIDNYDAGNGATATVGNSIVALNAADDDISGDGDFVYVSEGYNLIGGDISGVFTEPGDQTDVTEDDLQLGPLQDNGGLTQTIALGDGSIAIDAGNSDAALPEFDQRGEGFPRVYGDSVDVGAFEVQAEPVPAQLTVKGKVFNAVALAGLSGINITAVRVGNVSPSGQQTTGTDGTYSLALLPGTYRFIARKATDAAFRIAPGFANPAVLTADNTTNTAYNFRAIGIGGRVINPNNIGVSGVTLNLYRGSASNDVTTTLTTDSNGFFSFDGLAAGTWVVVPTAPTNLVYSPVSRTLVVADSAVFTSFTASVRINYSFSGRVTMNNNGNAQGVANATVLAVRASDKQAFTATTTVEGRYTIKDLTAGTYSVTVSNKGFVTTYTGASTMPLPLVLSAKSPTRSGVNFSVKRLVTGIAYNAVAIKGISGVTVSAVRRSDKAVFAVKTDTNGRFNSTLDVGTYDYSAVLSTNTGLRFNVTFPSPVAVTAAVSKDNGDHNFRAVGVTGRIVTDQNVGVSGVTVKLYASTDTAFKTALYTAVTDSNGFFSMDGTPDGNYVVVPTPTSTYGYAPVKQSVNVLGQAVFSSFTTRRK